MLKSRCSRADLWRHCNFLGAQLIFNESLVLNRYLLFLCVCRLRVCSPVCISKSAQCVCGERTPRWKGGAEDGRDVSTFSFTEKKKNSQFLSVKRRGAPPPFSSRRLDINGQQQQQHLLEGPAIKAPAVLLSKQRHHVPHKETESAAPKDAGGGKKIQFYNLPEFDREGNKENTMHEYQRERETQKELSR